MIHLLAALTDDQKALVGCLGALFASGLLMTLSYYVGRFRQQHGAGTSARAHVVAFPSSGGQNSSRRKAA